MAQVFGTSGRNAAEESHKRTKRLLAYGFCGIAALALLGGYAIGAALPIRRFGLASVLLFDAVLFSVIVVIAKWATRRIDAMDRDRMSWRKGAAGEALVAQTLSELPTEFIVVNDVSKRFGNIDHIVIGPTGVYVIDAKNWTGSVKADGQGELLLNGKPLPKPSIKGLLGSVMDFQSKLKALTETDYFVRGLMVFPVAYVEANYGSTRQIHCLRNERLIGYLEEQTFSQKLAASDIDKIKRATLQLAGMDQRFASSRAEDCVTNRSREE
jgi:Nuclease-related domain